MAYRALQSISTARLLVVAPAIALALPAQGADLLELRGTKAGEFVTTGPLVPPQIVVPDFVAEDETVFPSRVIVREPPPPGPPAPNQGDVGQSSSILRIGPAPSRGAPVADGRVDRPAPRPGSSGTLPGGDTEGGLVVVRQDVRDLIDQVAQFYGFETVLSRQVRGNIENTTLPSDFNAFLERLASDRDLVFYFRNRELNASTRDENVSRVVGLGQSSPSELRAAIEAAGIDADRFPLRYIEASNSVLVDGPPSFVALLEVIAESLVRAERPAPEVTIIRGNTIERSRPGQEGRQNGLAPIEFGPSVLDQPQEGSGGGAEPPSGETPGDQQNGATR